MLRGVGATMIRRTHLPIGVSYFAAISVVDVILIWQVLDDRVQNLDPFLKANNMVFGDVSRTVAFVKLDAAALFERGKFCDATRSFFYGPRVGHAGTKISSSG